jgi:diadenosine tetraphosphate (Ap4A) HIT family hydrolase
MKFEIHHQLLADCHYLGTLPACHVLVHKNAVLPWFILFPEVDVEDLLDVDSPTRNQIMQEAAWISAFIKQEMHCSKVNVAAIGNVVRQLHLHVVGRNPGDACWPLPVWGNLDTESSYSGKNIEAIVKKMCGCDPWGTLFHLCS